MATITLRVRTLGVEGVLRRFLVAASRLPSDTFDAQRELGREAEVVFGAYVPVLSGRELRGIGSDASGGGVTVTDYARNPQSGFDYVGVTRWGRGAIRPKHRQFGSYSLATGKRRSGGGALRFTVGGRVVFVKEVGPWKPASDWVTDALPEVEVAAQGVATRLGRKIESRF